MKEVSDWDSHWKDESQNSYWQKPSATVVLLLEMLDRNIQPDVLDLGCGIGRHSLLFAGAGFNVTAVDYAPDALDVLRQEAAERNLPVTVIEAEYTEDIFPGSSFDAVIAYNVLYHGRRESMKKAIQLAHKYLKPGGVFFFTCPARRDAKFGNGEEVAENTWKSMNGVIPGDTHYFADEADLADLLREFTRYSADIDEHWWDNNGIEQFSSYWQVTAVK